MITGDPVGDSSAEGEPSRSKTPSPNPSHMTRRASPGFHHAGPAASRIDWRSSSRVLRSTTVVEPSRTCMLRLRSTSTATQSGSTSSRGSSAIGPAMQTASSTRMRARIEPSRPRARPPASSRLYDQRAIPKAPTTTRTQSQPSNGRSHARRMFSASAGRSRIPNNHRPSVLFMPRHLHDASDRVPHRRSRR